MKEIFDADGNVVQRIYSDKDRKRQGEVSLAFSAIFFPIIVFLIIFSPIIAAGVFSYEYLHNSIGIHELFAAIISLIPVVISFWLLARFAVARVIYAAPAAAAFCYYVFLEARRDGFDAVWTSVVCLFAIFVSFIIIRFVYRLPSIKV